MVRVDVKPGETPNGFACGSKGNLPVAILGAPGFNATSAVITTVRLQGTVPALSKHVIKDVNRDGFADNTVYFTNSAVSAAIGCPLAKNTQVTVTVQGTTGSGVFFRGTDVIIRISK